MTKEERQAALNEVKVLSMLHHPNIIEYYENFLEDKALMIVMEYAQGMWLAVDWVEKHGNSIFRRAVFFQMYVNHKGSCVICKFVSTFVLVMLRIRSLYDIINSNWAVGFHI